MPAPIPQLVGDLSDRPASLPDDPHSTRFELRVVLVWGWRVIASPQVRTAAVLVPVTTLGGLGNDPPTVGCGFALLICCHLRRWSAGSRPNRRCSSPCNGDAGEVCSDSCCGAVLLGVTWPRAEGRRAAVGSTPSFCLPTLSASLFLVGRQRPRV